MKTVFTALSIILSVGLAQAQTFTNYTTADGLVNNGVNCLDVAANDVMWFGTQGGVSVFDGTTWTSHNTSTDAGFVDDVVTAIKVLSNGDVAIGTDFGFSHYNGTIWTTYTTTDGLGNNRIKTIYEGSDGVVYFGTNSGVTMFDGSTFTNFGTGDGLPFGGVTCFVERSTDVLYVGTALGGVTISTNGVFTEITENEGLLNDKVRAIVLDADNNKWIGTSDGISVYDDAEQLIAQHTTMFMLPAPDTLNPVEDIKIDSEGNVWVGVYVDYLVTEGGISAYNGTDWTQFDVSDGLIGPVVRQLAIDSEDNVWVATSTGISKISDVDLSGGSGAGILNSEKIRTLNIYPNPASDVVVIQVPDNTMANELKIYDSSLRLIETEYVAANSSYVRLSINDFPKGMYIIRVGQSVARLLVY
ncbi:MAG: T9SS type A sorting domain-containing protein [Flavobacteriales bacterium]|nr:T9SS type A sorting domain-containing protein [Flavobacteriales bacterium]